MTTYCIYIDESGDEGFSFGKGSPEWFVISAVVVKKAEDVATVKLVDDVRHRLNKPSRIPLHFRDLKHEQRLLFIDGIAKASLKVVSILVHKPSLLEPEKYQERYRLYFNAIRYLFERASWYCREYRSAHDGGDGNAEIVFSNRSGMAYDELCEYLHQLQAQTSMFDVRIDWTVIKPGQIMAYSAGRRMGLQIADAVASSFFYAVQPSQYGFVEDRYARMLKPVIFHERGRYNGYGVKFWPREVEERVKVDQSFGWFREYYG